MLPKYVPGRGLEECFIKPSRSNQRAVRAYEEARFREIDPVKHDRETEYGPREDPDTVYMVRPTT